MIKVLFVGHRDLYFGAESVLFRVIRLVHQNNTVKPMVLLPKTKDHGFRDELEKEGIIEIKRTKYKLIGGHFLRCLLCIAYNIWHLLPLYIYYRRKSADAVYTNTSVNISGALLALFLNKPHTWHWHEQPTPGTFQWIPKALYPFYRYLIRRKQNTIIFISHTQQVLWEKEFDMQISNSRVIYTPADEIPSLAPPANSVLAAALPIPSFGFLGSWTVSKNLLTLINAFATLRKKYPAKLVLMGAGDMKPAIQARIKELKLENDLHLMGHHTKVGPFFNAIDIFVLPSHFESWGLVVLEAIQQHKAVICTKHTALTEILTDQHDCLFIDPDETSQLEQAMERMLLYPELRQKMKENAFQTLRRLRLNEQFMGDIISLF